MINGSYWQCNRCEWCAQSSSVKFWDCQFTHLWNDGFIRSYVWQISFRQLWLLYNVKTGYGFMCFEEGKNIFAFTIISQDWYGTGSLNPSSGITRICLSYRVNSLHSSDAIWWHRSASPLAQVKVVAWQHQAITWTNVDLFTEGSLWHSPESNFTSDQDINP